jgi:hypothetical protein
MTSMVLKTKTSILGYQWERIRKHQQGQSKKR